MENSSPISTIQSVNLNHLIKENLVVCLDGWGVGSDLESRRLGYQTPKRYILLITCIDTYPCFKVRSVLKYEMLKAII